MLEEFWKLKRCVLKFGARPVRHFNTMYQASAKGAARPSTFLAATETASTNTDSLINGFILFVSNAFMV